MSANHVGLDGEQKFEAPGDEKDDEPHLKTAWRGTLLPKGDGDVWLTEAFAAHERYVALDRALHERHKGKFTPEALDRRSSAMFAYRAFYNHASSVKNVPLVAVNSDLRENHWHRFALGKGVLALEALGLEPKRDNISFLPTGDPVTMSQALEVGRIDAAVLDPALSRSLMSKGFSLVVDLAQANVFFPGLGFGATQAYIDQHGRWWKNS